MAIIDPITCHSSFSAWAAAACNSLHSPPLVPCTCANPKHSSGTGTGFTAGSLRIPNPGGGRRIDGAGGRGIAIVTAICILSGTGVSSGSDTSGA